MKSELVGIGEAAGILGLSRTSLQKLVDSGQLEAIKTAGGHRRISRASLDALNARMGAASLGIARRPPLNPSGAAAPASRSGAMRVLIAEDDEVIIEQMLGLLEKEFPRIEVEVARDGLDAVLKLERTRPSVLVTDLRMEPFDGFRLIQLVRSKPEYAGIALLVISSMAPKEIEKRGGLPEGVVFFRKPMPAERFCGYLQGHLQAAGYATH